MNDEILEAISKLTKAVQDLDATPHYSRKEYQLQMAPVLLQCAAIKYAGTQATIDDTDINAAIETAGKMYDAIKNGKALPDPNQKVKIEPNKPASFKTLNDLRMVLNGLSPAELRNPVRVRDPGDDAEIRSLDSLFALSETEQDVGEAYVPKGSLILW